MRLVTHSRESFVGHGRLDVKFALLNVHPLFRPMLRNLF